MSETTIKERTWKYIDKTTWGEGPWQHEPDKVQWVDEETGFDCLVVRAGDMGHLCGYVGVAKGHPFFQVDENSINPWPDVHGGLMYARFCVEGRGEHGICHVPFPGRPAHVWWLGFDCAHLGDTSPGIKSRRYDGDAGDAYRTVHYVRNQCRELARQFKEAETREAPK